MARLIRDLIEIPTEVHKGDFVLKLAEGVERKEETLRAYVVTPQLVDCFGRALGLVRSAVTEGRSKAAYLHGSFGSGKSHFMAVLHLLLQHDATARSIPELAPLVAQHAWAQGKRFLLVPFHLIGAESLEEAILGRYVEHVRALHPDAPVPPVFLSGPLFDNAVEHRERYGDEPFFRELNEGKSTSGWGSFGATLWDGASFERALGARPDDPLRLQLVSDLVAKLFPAYRQLAAGRGEGYVSLDLGLSVISRHAKQLGYDALVLFLDELILWLISRVGDLPFINREAAKLAKLVEAEHAARPVPIVSFVARQRDIRELVGEHLPGAERLSVYDTLKWSEGRFEIVTIEDRNLVAIASHRLLRPVDEAARQECDRAFEETTRVRPEVMQALLTSSGDRQIFRQVYPFSPALVQALVALSSTLQRERTALRVMLQLLVDQRDTLRLGDLVPVGDLYDVIASGDEPFTEEMRVHFQHAKRLYESKLRPELERHHGVTREQLRSGVVDEAVAVAYRADDRILKTLLLAALVPDIEVFRGLNATRLAALNHGSIQSPIGGGETRMVLSQCRQWASRIGEVKIGEDPVNPTIALQLSGVDTEAILEHARAEDNVGNRKRTIKQLLFQELGLPLTDSLLFPAREIVWRGTRRSVEVLFANIRGLPDESLRAPGEEWRLVIDYPFDDEDHAASDDVARLEEFRESQGPTRTLCWIPTFLSREVQRDLGRYVVIEHLLTGEERLQAASSHLSAVDRAQARVLLDNQRSQLRQRLLSACNAAYGLSLDSGGLTDGALDLADRFQSLEPRFRPRPPASATLREGLEALLDALFEHRYPKHPLFALQPGEELKPKMLKKVQEVAVRAAHEPMRRVEVDKEDRAVLRAIANPLELGQMYESAFVLGDFWSNALTQAVAAAGASGSAATVGRLREAFDRPEPRGLTREVQDLLILVFAEQTNRSFFRHGVAFPAEIGRLDDECELRAQPLPSEPDWGVARDRAARLFGLAPDSFLSAANVSKLEGELWQRATEWRAPCSDLVGELERWTASFVPPVNTAARLKTAQATLRLVEAIHRDQATVLRALLEASVPTTLEAMAASGSRAATTTAALRETQQGILQALRNVVDGRRARAESLLAELGEALGRDELAVPLAPTLRSLIDRAAALLAEVAPPPPPPPSPRGWRLVAQGEEVLPDPSAARALFTDLAGQLSSPDRRLSIRWTVEEKKEGS